MVAPALDGPISQGIGAVQSTVCMSLLQPQRETYNLFDDVLLLADGKCGDSCIHCQVDQESRLLSVYQRALSGCQ